MMKTTLFRALLMSAVVNSQTPVKSVQIPMGSLLTEALVNSSLTSPGSKPFHIRIEISEPENPQSPYRGFIEEWWASAQDWRREVISQDGVRQTIVHASGIKTEEDTGDYFPNWLGRFVNAVFDPVPDAAAWNLKNVMISQFALPNGSKMNGCGRVSTVIGSGDSATVQFSSICFGQHGHLNSVDGPGVAVLFQEFRYFGKREVPQGILDHEEHARKLVGKVTKLEELPKSKLPDIFKPLARNDGFFESVRVDSKQMQVLCSRLSKLSWPPVRSGEVQGHVVLYLSVDKAGRVREAFASPGDNAEISEFAKEQVTKWTLPPFTDAAGRPVQMEGALSLPFETTIGDPSPK